tara:strand:- start:3057 stop:3425 length:369 start_codon:yes stop_codon:yes gene_type:complete
MDKNTQNIKTDGTEGTLSDKKRKFVKQLTENLGNVSKTCEQLKVGRRTYYNWLEDEEFEEAVRDAEESLLDESEFQLMDAIKNGNLTAIIFHLKTKGRKRGYDEKQQIEIVKPFDRIELEDI